MELLPFGGISLFSSDFHAGADWNAGALVYVPVPILPTGNYGIFGGVLLGNLDRNLDPPQPNSGGLYEMGILGGYYTFFKNENFLFRAGLGGSYVAYNGTVGLKDGFGGVFNLELAVYSLENKPGSGLAYSPLFIFDGKSFIVANVFGIWITW
jgi:hypothetical protein